MSSKRPDFTAYLHPTRVIDSDHPAVIAFAQHVAEETPNALQQAVGLYNAVRDRIRYDPYRIELTPEAMRASAVLARGFGFCVAKAVVLAAAARAVGIPSRLGFADVKNHLTTERLRRLMQTDVFAFHGYTELFLDGTWVKATPAFNRSLCDRFDVEPLAFDGRHDSMFQQFDRKGNRYMEYVRDRGHFADLPLDDMRAAFEEHYPSLLSRRAFELTETFEDEVDADPARETGADEHR